MKMNENNNNGLKHKECLQILFNQIHDELIKFKTERLKIRVIARSYFKENIFQFLHNFLSIFISSIILFILNTDG
jgi:hypothetical protein